MLTAVLLGYLAADLVSGLVHWAADTWGSPDLPVVGPAVLGPFREHHRDPLAITRHDFVETNGNNCLISLPVLGAAVWLSPGADGRGSVFVSSFLGALVFWVLLTNQFHKWAHLPEPPPLLAFLQRWHLILPPAHHAAAPHPALYDALLHHHRLAELAPRLGALLSCARVVHHRLHRGAPPPRRPRDARGHPGDGGHVAAPAVQRPADSQLTNVLGRAARTAPPDMGVGCY